MRVTCSSPYYSSSASYCTLSFRDALEQPDGVQVFGCDERERDRVADRLVERVVRARAEQERLVLRAHRF